MKKVKIRRSYTVRMVPDVAVFHRWSHLADLGDWRAIARIDLDAARAAWAREKSSIKDPSRQEQVVQGIAMRWAIETGVIERLYTVDRGTTESLVAAGLAALEGFSSAGRLSVSASRLIGDQREALDFVYEGIRQRRPFSTSYVRELHQLLCRNQTTHEALTPDGKSVKLELHRGAWKMQPNNPRRLDGLIHEYCPPEFVQDEMDALIRMHAEHTEAGVRPEVEAAWLHHRFAQIHPFEDGNGRVARALATLVFLQHGFLPLVVRDAEHRDPYIDALEAADTGDLGPLVNLFANIQSNDLDEAITLVRDVRAGGIGAIAEAAAAAAARSQGQRQSQLAERSTALLVIASDRLMEIGASLEPVFAGAGVVLRTNILSSDESNASWWSRQIVGAGKRYHYFVDLARPRSWVRLKLSVEGAAPYVAHVVVSFHHKEQRTGLMACAVFLTAAEADYEESRPVEFGSPSEFTFSAESADEAQFRNWLESALAVVLNAWQSRL